MFKATDLSHNSFKPRRGGMLILKIERRETRPFLIIRVVAHAGFLSASTSSCVRRRVHISPPRPFLQRFKTEHKAGETPNDWTCLNWQT